MPDVADLLELICRESGLSDSSADQAIALGALNRSYRRVNAEVKRRIPSSANVTAALDIDLSVSVPTLASLDSVFRVDGDRLLEMERTTPEVLLSMRDADGDGTPSYYAVLSGTLLLNAIETTGTVSTIQLRFTAKPTALTAASAEADIVGVSPLYHEDLLGTMSVCYVLEGTEGEEERASYYRQLLAETMRLFKKDANREGGAANQRLDDIHGRWSTPSPRSAR